MSFPLRRVTAKRAAALNKNMHKSFIFVKNVKKKKNENGFKMHRLQRKKKGILREIGLFYKKKRVRFMRNYAFYTEMQRL